MSEFKFYNAYSNRPVAAAEKHAGKVLVEKAGYIPAQVRIENMINAGLRLGLARKEQFDDFSQGEPDVDPTRKPGYDLAEASTYLNAVSARVKAKRAVKTDAKTPGTSPQAAASGAPAPEVGK